MDAVFARPARHKQVIASTKVDRGAALRYAGNTLNAFQFSLNEGAGTVHTVCVFYGTSLTLIANDTLWAKYHLFDVLDAAGDPLSMLPHTPKNPFLHAFSSMRKTDAPSDKHDYSVEALTARGVTWFACDNALHSLAEQIGSVQHVDPAHVYTDFRRGLYPGTLVVPAGVAALVLAQEAHFTLLPTT